MLPPELGSVAEGGPAHLNLHILDPGNSVQLRKRRTDLARALPQHVERFSGTLPGDRGHPWLEDPRLLPRHERQRIPQLHGVIHCHIGDDGQCRLEHIGRIEPPPQPDLHHRRLDTRLREAEEGDSGGRLEEAGPGLLDRELQPAGSGDDPLLRHRYAVHLDSLCEGFQVGRGIQPHRPPLPRLQRSGAEGRHGTLPVGPGDVHRTKKPMGISPTGEQGARCIEPPLDSAGRSLEQPGGQIVERHPAAADRFGCSGAGRPIM